MLSNYLEYFLQRGAVTRSASVSEVYRHYIALHTGSPERPAIRVIHPEISDIGGGTFVITCNSMYE